MIQLTHGKQKNKHRRRTANGFTMVEVVIAGVILVSTMTAVAQMGVLALAGSKNRDFRKDIEEAVNYDIQLLQKSDSYLTYNDLKAEGKEEVACADPTNYLISYLQTSVDSSMLSERGIIRNMQVGVTDDVVEVSYRFKGPETNIGNEYRFIELNPNFSAKCYTIQ